MKTEVIPEIELVKQETLFDSGIKLVREKNGVFIYKVSLNSPIPVEPKPIKIRWKLPSINAKGVWKPGALHNKRQQYDWELEHLHSRISVDAPVISVFGHNDHNLITFACSDAINLLELNALLREENNHLYCHISFFTERHPAIQNYEAYLRIDYRPIIFSEAIESVAKWWEEFESLKPSITPDLAKAPMYSTWYNFHQDLDEDLLLQECKIAAEIGYELLLLDDGWQTMDTNRGYDYTGDWQPDRFPDMPGFVDKVHDIGMKLGIWFSVPFCGKKSKAYQKFKGKFLTENHRWAPVFDPRYPEVREYLIGIYKTALLEWNIDAFKLDFIDDFKVYPETELTKKNGRDFANVNSAVDRLLSDVMDSLRKLKPDIAIEFRQKYIGPAMRKFGNMFRAFDCPNDPVTNRIRITDVKLLCGNTAVHSDMLTWHPEEKAEIAALQLLNAFFGVPQMSIHLRHASEEHLEMITFYTNYWRKNSDIILAGKFTPINPLANYPILKTEKNGKSILGVYDDVVAAIVFEKQIDFLNAKFSENIIVRNTGTENEVNLHSFNCQGKLIFNQKIILKKGINELPVPPAGLLQLK
ncbi:MAG: glycoside hydrolase family 36 protein [Bacteroidota bacterium]